MPQTWCEIAFTKDVTDASPIWTDVTSYVQWWAGVRISRRRSHELDEVQPGKLSLNLDNTDGRFTAGRTGSPYYPNVKLNRLIRIRTRWPVSVNLLLEGQAKGSNTALFSVSTGTLALDGSAPAGQTSSIRWDSAGTVSAQFRLGASAVTTATDKATLVTAGSQYTLSMQIKRGATALSVRARIRWFDAAGAFLSETVGSAVALTTSFAALSVTGTAPANATSARALVTIDSSGGTVAMYTSAMQFEQASSATTWVSPGVEYIRYTGFIDRWPHAWTNGVLGVANITATDRMKLLNRDRIRGALNEEILGTSPTFFYPMSEPQDSTAAGNLAATSQPDMQIQQAGSGGTIEFGERGGPDQQTGALLTPASTSNGLLLTVPLLYTELGGVSGISLAAWVDFGASPLAADQRIVYVDDGSDTVHARLNYNPTSNTLTVGVRTVGPAFVSTTTSFNLDDNNLHLAVVTIQFSGGNILIKAYVDGTLAINTSNATSITTWPALPRVRVGGLPGTALDPPELMQGMIAGVAGWNTVLSAGQVTDLYGARDAFAGELSGARAERIAEWAGVTATSIDVGSSAMDRHPNSDSSPLAALKVVAKSEAGLVFIAGDGTLTMHGRLRRQLPSTAAITLTADQCGTDLVFVMDDTLLINDVTVTRSGQTSTRVIDQTSITENEGIYTGSIDTLLYTDVEALDRAAYTVSSYGYPQPRGGPVSVEAHSLGTVWPQMLASEIGQRMQITSLPSDAPSSTLDLWCEGVQELITDQEWRFTFDTSPVRNTPLFILDDATYGTLDNNYLGW